VQATTLEAFPISLEWGDTIRARVTATNIKGESDPSESSDFNFVAVPAAPKITRKISEGETSLTLEFEDGF